MSEHDDWHRDDYSSFDHDLHRSALDDVHGTTNNVFERWGHPYATGTFPDDLYESPGPSADRQSIHFDGAGSLTDKPGITIGDLALMVVLGIIGAILLSIIF